MYVCMSVHMYICMYIGESKRTCALICVYVQCMSACRYVSVHVCMSVHMYICMYIGESKRTCALMCVYVQFMNVRMYVCYVCMHTDICLCIWWGLCVLVLLSSFIHMSRFRICMFQVCMHSCTYTRIHTHTYKTSPSRVLALGQKRPNHHPRSARVIHTHRYIHTKHHLPELLHSSKNDESTILAPCFLADFTRESLPGMFFWFLSTTMYSTLRVTIL